MKAAILSAALICAFIGCASVPVTVAQAEISGILDSGVFDDAHVVTLEDKAKLRLAMTHARDNIGAAEERCTGTCESCRRWGGRLVGKRPKKRS